MEPMVVMFSSMAAVFPDATSTLSACPMAPCEISSIATHTCPEVMVACCAESESSVPDAVTISDISLVRPIMLLSFSERFLAER